MNTLTKNDLYYLRSIKRQLEEVRAIANNVGLSLSYMALSDNIDWLDCFIDRHERSMK